MWIAAPEQGLNTNPKTPEAPACSLPAATGPERGGTARAFPWHPQETPPMPDAETPEANKEARDDAAGKSPEQQAKEGKEFLKDERKRELPKDSWPGKDGH